MITVSNVSLTFGGQKLFSGADLKFMPGNCYGVIGANGAGKSTFLRILSGELEPTTGTVTIPAGQRLSTLKQDQFKYDAYPVLDTVIMGNQRLYDIMKEKDELYAKPDFSDADGERDAELEGEYAEISVDEPVIIEANAGAEAPPLSFSAETDQLLWPIAGNILMDFSMDKTVYFSTLDQYKYNPAIIIEGSVDQNVLSAASGKVISIENVDETGTTITMDIGSGYQVIYGQIKEPAVQQGDYVQAGALIGYVAEPTRFYSKEGSNLYFQVLKDGESINPKELLP